MPAVMSKPALVWKQSVQAACETKRVLISRYMLVDKLRLEVFVVHLWVRGLLEAVYLMMGRDTQ